MLKAALRDLAAWQAPMVAKVERAARSQAVSGSALESPLSREKVNGLRRVQVVMKQLETMGSLDP